MKKNLLSIIFALISTLGFSQAPSYVPANGLVGWWPFNGNANDESGNGNNGTNNGATLTTDRNGVTNQAYSFDGVDDYISILRNYQGSFTTSIWFNSNGNSQYKPLIDAFDVNWEIQIMNSFLAYVSFDNSSNLQVFNSSVLITNNNWNNLICTYNSNILNFYLNGTQIDQFTVNTLPINSGNYFLGASQTGSDQYFEGKLDDIGIWNRALTPQEITNLYTSTVPVSCLPAYVPTSGLVGYWPFCGNANDESGNGNNGTVNGATLTTDRNGVVDKAYSFDGYNDLIRIQHQNTLNLMGDYSISVWYKGNYQNIFNNNWNFIAKRDDNGNCCSPNVPYQIAIPFNSTNYAVPLMVYANGNYTFSTLPNSSPISLDQWQNLIITNTSDLLKFYINGQLIFSENISSTLRAPNTSDLLIGSVNRELGVEWMNGKLDDIGIWNRALTQQEIINLYTSTVPVSCLPAYVPTSGLVGYWPFCGNANDESGNGNNGIVNGATLTTDRNGVANQAYSFDGVNDFIEIPYSSLYVNEQLTISYWKKDSVLINDSDLMFGNPTSAIWCTQVGPNFVGMYNNLGCNGFDAGLTTTNFINNSWSLLSFVINNNSTSVYKNGIFIGSWNSSVISTSNCNLTTYKLYLGVDIWSASEYYKFKLDDIGIWNRALTDCEIQNLYTSTNPTNTTSETACDSYTWNGTTYSASGVYTGTTASCVTESLNLIITPSSTNTTTATACESYTWNETTYTSSGVYAGTTANCVTESLNLTITPSSTNTTSASACDSYSWNGTTYTATGVYTGATTNCVTESLDLTITPSSANTTAATACDSYTWNGQTYTQSGIYTETTANCVTESLNLTITTSSTNTTTASACDSYVWNGTTYTATGVYTGTTTNCVTESLNLTITPSSTNTTTASACNNYTWNGQAYTQSGVYTGTTTDCVTQSLNLTITPSSTNTTTASACNNYTWNGQAYTQSGVYTGTTANCVTQALNLTINTNTSSSITQTALDSYTWPVNNQTYTTTGAYTAVIPNAAGCDSTITLNLTMSFTGINDLSASKLTIYPNPTNGDFTITGLELVGTVSSLTLTDMNGKVVKVLDTKATKFSIASIKPGVYFLNIISENKQEVLKIVKE